MRKSSVRVHGLILSAACFFSVGWSSIASAQQTAKGKGYTVAYPIGWTLKPAYMGTETMGLSTSEGADDGFYENCNTVQEPLPKAMNAKAYFELSLPSLQSLLTEFKVVTSNKIIVGKTKGHDLRYIHEMSGLNLVVRAVFFTQNKTGFVVTCTGLNETFTRFENRFEEVIRSFQFTSIKPKKKAKKAKTEEDS